MKTLIFDIDGTLTDMWPIERQVLVSLLGNNPDAKLDLLYNSGLKNLFLLWNKVSGQKTFKKDFYRRYTEDFIKLRKQNVLPFPVIFPLVEWIKKRGKQYHLIYATAGRLCETEYVLNMLKIFHLFDSENSISKDNCRFSKNSGIPFMKIKKKFPDCMLITDSDADIFGASKIGIPSQKVIPNQKVLNINF